MKKYSFYFPQTVPNALSLQYGHNLWLFLRTARASDWFWPLTKPTCYRGFIWAGALSGQFHYTSPPDSQALPRHVATNGAGWHDLMFFLLQDAMTAMSLRHKFRHCCSLKYCVNQTAWTLTCYSPVFRQNATVRIL